MAAGTWVPNACLVSPPFAFSSSARALAISEGAWELSGASSWLVSRIWCYHRCYGFF